MTEQQFWNIAAPYLGEDKPAPTLWAERRKDREQVQLRIYCPKDPDANPYYSSNHLLYRCTQAASAVLSAGSRVSAENEEYQLLLKLYLCETEQEQGKAPEEMAEALLGSDSSLVRDFCWFITRDIMKIERMAGGHRGSIKNDTEIEISALLLPWHSREDFICAAKQACDRELACMDVL